MKSTALAAGIFPLTARAAPTSPESTTSLVAFASKDKLPMGKIGGVEFSRLMLGGNVIAGYAHSRDLPYVNKLMLRYNTETKILETLELAEAHGINALNSPAWSSPGFLKKHWARGGRMKWIAQAMPKRSGFADMFKQAVDDGATAVQFEGDAAERCLKEGRFADIVRAIEFIKSQKCLAGVGTHGVPVVEECEKAKVPVDFYLKTLHAHEYFTGPKTIEKDDIGRYDNYWCRDPEEVIDLMLHVKKPWIAFKVMAAGAIPPRRAFSHAFNNGADFVLAGMFDWQIAEDVQIAKSVLEVVRRHRPWCDSAAT